MKHINLLLIQVFFFIFINGHAQNSYQLGFGTSMPDNIINKYLKPGIYLKYGIDFKLMNNLYLNTNISITYNNKNSNYKLGYEDEPRFINNPDAVEFYEMSQPDYSMFPFYFFNTSLGLNLKYTFLPQKKLYPYFLTGMSANYSIAEEALIDFMFDKDNNYEGFFVSSDGESPQKFTIGYQAGIGVNYSFKKGIAGFIESRYKLLPDIKFGRYKDRVGLFTLGAGINFYFNKE